MIGKMNDVLLNRPGPCDPEGQLALEPFASPVDAAIGGLVEIVRES